MRLPLWGGLILGVLLSFLAPAQDLLRFFAMERPGFALKFGSASLLGVFIGAFASAVVARRFAWTTPTVCRCARRLRPEGETP